MFPRGNSMEGVETGRTRSYGAAAEYKSHLPDMRLCFQRQSQDAGVVQMHLLRTSGKRGRRGAINSKERGRSSLACGESEKNAQAQVNPGRSKKPAPNQQQEYTEVISSACSRHTRESPSFTAERTSTNVSFKNRWGNSSFFHPQHPQFRRTGRLSPPLPHSGPPHRPECVPEAPIG